LISTLAPSGVPYRMSVATASARLRVRLIKTISRALPRIVAAMAHAQPTLPAPTIPIFMDVSIFSYQLVRCGHRSQKLALHAYAPLSASAPPSIAILGADRASRPCQAPSAL